MSGVAYTGVPSAEELASCPGIADAERFEKGPVAVIECFQEIPCNPCEHACSSGAITVGSPITRLPVLDAAKCIGCGECLAPCPGLAIFLVHKNYTASTSLVGFPYEYLPLPEEGDSVPCCGRDGNFIADGRVVKVKKTQAGDGTAVILVEIPKEFFMDIRGIYKKGDET